MLGVSALLRAEPIRMAVGIAGALLLAYFGIRYLLTSTYAAPTERHDASLPKSSAFGAGLTLTNPLTILSFAAIFAGLGVGSAGGNYVLAGLLVLGVFMGSALWWLILSGVVGAVRTKFSPSSLRWVNRVSGIIITGFGLLSFLSLLR